MKERSRWLQVPLFMQRFPDHWQTLQNWALADSALTSERLDRINQHRAWIERITRHMVL
jgi:hypothetical protein